jgi:Ca-activated chloride channel family protein
VIQWGEPRVLPWLWVLIPLAGLVFFLVARRERRLRLILDDGASALLSPERRRGLVWAKTALWFVACALVIVALARPRWGIRWQESMRRGLDILVVVDTSESMRATDLTPRAGEVGTSATCSGLPEPCRPGGVCGSSFLACPPGPRPSP